MLAEHYMYAKETHCKTFLGMYTNVTYVNVLHIILCTNRYFLAV